MSVQDMIGLVRRHRMSYTELARVAYEAYRGVSVMAWRDNPAWGSLEQATRDAWREAVEKNESMVHDTEGYAYAGLIDCGGHPSEARIIAFIERAIRCSRDFQIARSMSSYLDIDADEARVTETASLFRDLYSVYCKHTYGEDYSKSIENIGQLSVEYSELFLDPCSSMLFVPKEDCEAYLEQNRKELLSEDIINNTRDTIMDKTLILIAGTAVRIVRG